MFKALFGHQVNKYCTDILCKFIISYRNIVCSKFIKIVSTLKPQYNEQVYQTLFDHYIE